MSSSSHDALNELLRRRPQWALELLHDICGVPVSPHSPARLEPPGAGARQGSAVVSAEPEHAPGHTVLVEFRRERGQRARGELARRAARLWLTYGRQVRVLLLAADDETAAFYDTPVQTTLRGYTFRPHVVWPEEVPVIGDPGNAARHLELALLGVVLHGEEHPEVITAFKKAAYALPEEETDAYTGCCRDLSSPAVVALFEAASI